MTMKALVGIGIVALVVVAIFVATKKKKPKMISFNGTDETEPQTEGIPMEITIDIGEGGGEELHTIT